MKAPFSHYIFLMTMTGDFVKPFTIQQTSAIAPHGVHPHPRCTSRSTATLLLPTQRSSSPSNSRIRRKSLIPKITIRPRLLARLLIIPPIPTIPPPLIPPITRPLRLHDRRITRRPELRLRDVLRLHNLRGQAEGSVQGDVAVHDPGARVVEAEGDDGVAVLGQEDDVPSGRVVGGEVDAVGEGLVGDLLQDGEVVAVEVDLRR